MKIIVSHLGKQHVNAVLVGLAKFGVLQRFYTSIAANKVSFIKNWSQKVWQKVQKRHFDIRPDQIKQLPVTAVLTSLTQHEYTNVRVGYNLFDWWVANRLKHEDFDIVIGYENATLHTFRRAKALGKITVLDLAAVYHSYQNEILFKVGAFTNSTETNYINRRKDAAFEYTDYILTISTMAKKSLTDYGVPPEKIFLVYLGYNQNLFVPKKHYNGSQLKIKNLELKPAQNIENTEGGNFELEIKNLELKTGSDQFVNTSNDILDPIKPNLHSENTSYFIPHTSYSTLHTSKLELYFVGTMGKRKGFAFLMRVLERLLSENLNVRLTVIGPVDDVQPPTAETPHYRYMPFVPQAELVKLHHELDLFIFPTNMDSWAQVVVEAMACGSPVLVSENTGAKDAVVQGGGLVLPVGDENAWVEAIKKVYDDRNLLQSMGEKAAKVVRQYTWEAYHQQVFDAMQTIYRTEHGKMSSKTQKNTPSVKSIKN